MTTIARVIGLALLLSLPTFASDDLTGKWAGSFQVTGDGQTQDATTFLDLKQNGVELTGTAGPDAGTQWPIQRGKVEGNRLSFEVDANGMRIQFDLALTDGHLKGEARAERDGRSIRAAVDVQRKAE